MTVFVMLAGVFTTVVTGIIGITSLGLAFKGRIDFDDRRTVEQTQVELILFEFQHQLFEYYYAKEHSNSYHHSQSLRLNPTKYDYGFY
ncbi:unnamed protein product [Rotaria magnacalcarata]|uniref:Uncharacterized protein n=1 Tax=Rotaria magnacalcarata TaxID=392030 RepID=A0A816QAR9_9BILA|nr:unnamed protein product [Rotaria magnacalcarata]CAF3764976.1 unnamed protein product [Rotaria magnacalcarata]CAF4033922.1 unnamed protein product [Rotaria magnacalcarata]